MNPDDALTEWLNAQWAVPADTFTVEVEGADIACRGWNLEARHLPPVLLIHGFRAHARWWDHIGPALSRDYRVLALDLSGSGDSARREVYSRRQHGREMIAAAQAAGFEKPVLIAHSFGAMCGLLAAHDHPDDVGRLVVIDSALPLDDDMNRQMPTGERRVYATKEEALARFRLVPSGRWPNADIMAYIGEHSLIQAPDGWTWKFDVKESETLNLEPDPRPDMFGQTVPVDIMYGEFTELMDPARIALAREMAPHAGRDIVIPNAHHHVMIEQPLAFLGALRGLLANHQDIARS